VGRIRELISGLKHRVETSKLETCSSSGVDSFRRISRKVQRRERSWRYGHISWVQMMGKDMQGSSKRNR
jgi:hypothetical protein